MGTTLRKANTKLLVLVEGYPSEKNAYTLAFVHTRMLDYAEAGFDVTVLSFQAAQPYSFGGISVVSPGFFERVDTTANYDIVLSHAPNLRNHFRFLERNRQQIRKLIFFIHGHEVLVKRNHYPEPYPFERPPWLKKVADHFYDLIKVRLVGRLLNQWLRTGNSHIVFVSQWMKERTLESLSLDRHLVESRSSVIHNCVHPLFIRGRHKPSQVLADFVTLRPLDGSKYGIDLVSKIAQRNPQLTFHVYGRGRYFQHNPTPPNLQWFDRFIQQADLPELLDHYSCALMPTRLDAQGVSVCEFATYGMPLYTSDLEVCREMLLEFENVRFFNHDRSEEFSHITPFRSSMTVAAQNKFSAANTTQKEIELLRSLHLKGPARAY